MSFCPTCGRSLSDHDRHFRFELPVPVLDSPDGIGAPGTWLSHGDANSSVMMQVPGVGPFVRALLPVKLTEGHTVTFGVWVCISPADIQRTFAVWHNDDYIDLEIEGVLANDIPPWKLVGLHVQLRVLDKDQTPHCVASSDPLLESVLSSTWAHHEILRSFWLGAE